MPQVNTPTIEDSNGIFTKYTDNATTTKQTFTFTQEQNGMTFWNKGDSVITLTINGTKHTVPSKSAIQIDDDDFTSFDAETVTGTQGFELKAFVKKAGAAKKEDIINLNAQLAQNASLIGGAASNLKGKTWITIGDSITQVTTRATKNYHAYIADWTQCIIDNRGVSGTGWFTPNTAGATNGFYQRIPSLPANADLITIFGGTNDWGETGKPLVLGALGDTDGSVSFYGAVDSTLSQLIAKYPTKTIAVFTPLQRSNAFNGATNSSGITLKQVADAIIDVCEKYGIPVLDLYRKGGLFPWNATSNQTYFSSATSPTGDGLHPNEIGHEKIAHQIYQFLNELMGSKLYIDTIAPSVPTGLQATSGNTQVTLNWVANNETDLLGYNVYVDGTKNNADIITTTSYTVTGLTNEIQYSFQITAVDKSNNESERTSAATSTPATPIIENITDTFTRANSTTSLGAADTGQSWQVLNGVWGISSNQAYAVSGTDAAAVIDSGISDGNIEVKHSAITGFNRLVFRATDASNYFIVQSDTGGGKYTCFRRQNGSFTSLGSTTGITPAVNDIVKVNLNGSAITLYVNGTSVLTATDAFNQTATKHGVGTSSTSSRFDDFKITV